jgi:anti-sigma factor RsiW
MTCRKVSRELLERFRFGEELDARSAPHLEHLQTCLACREEVGVDRALAAQLRRALQARVDGYEPSAGSWQLVRERALAAEGAALGWTTWFRRLTAGLRASGAVAAVALVLMIGTGGPAGAADVADFQLSATGRGQVAWSDSLPSDPPPYEAPRVWYPPTPLPPPAAGRQSVIMTYGTTGEAVATTRPVPRPVTGLLR